MAEPPAAGTEAVAALRVTVPRLKLRAERFVRELVLKLDWVAMEPNSSSMPTVAPRPPP